MLVALVAVTLALVPTVIKTDEPIAVTIPKVPAAVLSKISTKSPVLKPVVETTVSSVGACVTLASAVLVVVKVSVPIFDT